jgi:GNAT superfamily N-acetyltransferase
VTEAPLRVERDEDIAACFDVMAELRPHLRREDFVAQVRTMAAEGYRLASLRHDGEIACVAGYRIATNFHLGRYLYIDDLVSATRHRGKGLGAAMLAWLRQQARAEGCRYLHLDSGTQRLGAHKFYFCQGMSIGSFHFYEPLPAKADDAGEA